jgi:tetratricopeptide (TPR) repeat protein
MTSHCSIAASLRLAVLLGAALIASGSAPAAPAHHAGQQPVTLIADPESDLRAHFTKATAALARDAYDEAIREAGIVVRGASETSQKQLLIAALGVRAGAAGAKGAVDSSLADWSRMLKLEPDHGVARMMRGSIHIMQKNWDGVVADFTKLIDDNSAPDASFAYASRALGYFGKSQYPPALRDLDRSISLGAKDPAFHLRCLIRGIAGRVGEALEDCNTALKAKPGNPEYLEARGFINLKAGNLDRAIADYNEALRINPKLANCLYGLGLARVRQERSPAIVFQGWTNIEKAKELSPDVAERFASWGVRP